MGWQSLPERDVPLVWTSAILATDEPVSRSATDRLEQLGERTGCRLGPQAMRPLELCSKRCGADFGNANLMLWLASVAGGVGFLFGLLLLRVHHVALSSATLAVCCAAAVPLAQWNILASVALMFISVGALQCGYLAGLTALRMSIRARTAEPIWRPDSSGTGHSAPP